MKPAFSPSVSSAVAKWVIRPATSRRSRRGGRIGERGDVLGAGSQPAHARVELQVHAGRAPRPPPRRRAPRRPGVHTATSAPRRRRAPTRCPRGGPSPSTGASMPASRRVSASAAVATPSAVAPPSSAARAAGTAPCPYPSALTTAIIRAPPATLTSRPALWRIAPRSIRATARGLVTGEARTAAAGRRGAPPARRRRSCRRRGRPARRRARGPPPRRRPPRKGSIPLASSGGDRAGEHVAGAGGRQRRGASGAHRDVAAGAGHDRARPLQQHHSPGPPRQLSRRVQPCRPRPRRAGGPAGAPASPAWGVITVAAARRARRSGASPRCQSPSASSTAGSATRSRIWSDGLGRGLRAAEARADRQGARAAGLRLDPLDRLRGEVAVSSGSGAHITSSRCAATAGWTAAGTATTVRPARRGAWPARPCSPRR